jgi:hypothetical protein
MTTKLAVITTEFLRNFVIGSLEALHPSFEYEVYAYSLFSGLGDLYSSLPSNVDGVVTSGFFPTEILRRAFPDSAHGIYSFNNDHADLYKLLFHLLQANRSLALERIHMDVLHMLGLTTPEYVKTPLLQSLDSQLLTQASRFSLEDLLRMDRACAETHLALWQQGRVDVCVTRFSGIVKALTEAGLPVHFVYPNRTYLESVFTWVTRDIHLRRLHDNQAAAMVVTVGKNAPPEALTGRQAALQRSLAMFFSFTPMRLVARPVERGVDILLDRKGVDAITEHFHACRLQDFLREDLGFAVHIGYGLGETVHQARINAIDANREAGLSAASASFLINERGEMISLTEPDKRFVVPRAMSETMNDLAMRSNLSSLTLQKIEAALGATADRRTTSEGLAEKLSITKRSANRILRALSESGAAEIVSLQRGTTRGRPERVYRIAPM